MRTVATNVARNAGRGTRRRLAHEVATDLLPDAVEVAHPLKTPLPVQRLELERAIASLPDNARAIYLMMEVEGLEHAEVAARIGIAEGTVRGQLHRARTLLRASLDAAVPPAPVSSRRLQRGLPIAAAALALLAGTATLVRYEGATRAPVSARARASGTDRVDASLPSLEQQLDEDRLLLAQVDAMLPGRAAADVAALRAVRSRLAALVARVERSSTTPLGPEERATLERERAMLHDALRERAR